MSHTLLALSSLVPGRARRRSCKVRGCVAEVLAVWYVFATWQSVCVVCVCVVCVCVCGLCVCV